MLRRLVGPEQPLPDEAAVDERPVAEMHVGLADAVWERLLLHIGELVLAVLKLSGQLFHLLFKLVKVVFSLLACGFLRVQIPGHVVFLLLKLGLFLIKLIHFFLNLLELEFQLLNFT